MTTDTTIMRFVAEIPKAAFSKNVVLDVLGQLSQQLADGDLSVEDFIADSSQETMEVVDIVFDGRAATGPDTGHFVETEDLSGRSVGVGEWVDLGDGYLRLRIPVSAANVRRDQ